MPSNVARFEALMYISVAIGIVFSAAQWEAFLTRAQDSGEIRYLFMVAVCLILLRLALIWLTARKRQNWARWVLLLLLVVGLPQFVKSLGPMLSMHPVTGAARITQFALDVVAFIFIFTGDARDWFNLTPDPLASINQGSPIRPHF